MISSPIPYIAHKSWHPFYLYVQWYLVLTDTKIANFQYNEVFSWDPTSFLFIFMYGYFTLMNTILTQICGQPNRNPPHTETSIINVTNFITKSLGKMAHTVPNLTLRMRNERCGKEKGVKNDPKDLRITENNKTSHTGHRKGVLVGKKSHE